MKLKQYLYEHRLTAREFGEMVGSSEYAAGKWVRGERTPRTETLRLIAEVTDGAVTANDFVGDAAS